MSLIRGSPQRAILGPVRLARRPASHPPDQRQDSAVTYVALCVVSAIATEKRFFIGSDDAQGMALCCSITWRPTAFRLPTQASHP
ncbi:Uncharacterized protein ALO88_05498 [Pseudomonas syringae pv. antirrhini]|uniref:Uncharacterized protein n=1 Tax=Pseudomonas syringae pv. antirrhini TaxID=251702 RepID=A0A0P9K7Y3_9PSED|nr:Uncharacterized protein ALO88_05498 [Pseudomonas syringae pv. antirrhini]